MNKYVYLVLVLVVAFAGAWLARPSDGPAAIGGQNIPLSGAATSGEIRLASASSTQILAANPARQFARICRVDGNTATIEVSLNVGAAAEKDRGIQLRPNTDECFEITEAALFTGAVNGIASISGSGDYASVSYFEF